MRFKICGFETIKRVNKQTGQESNGIQLYLLYQTNNVVGSAIRSEYFGSNSPAYPALNQMLATNATGLVGSECLIDYDVAIYGDKAYKKLVSFELVPHK